MKKVITIGSAVIDVILKSDRFKVMKGHNIPGGVALCEVLGGKQEAEEGVLDTGGGATNVGVGLRRLGQSVRVITRIGDDDLSELIMDKLKNENVGTELVQRGKGKTGMSAVLVAPDGGRSIVTYRGESGEIDGKEIDWKELEKADWLQISSLGGQTDLLEDLVVFAYERHIGVGLNPGKRELEEGERIKKLLPKINFFNLNRMEAGILWGVEFEDEKAMADAFVKAKSPLTVITDGKRGASIVSNEKWLKIDAFSSKSVDDTGAGDGFVSGMVGGMLQGRKTEEALKMGLADGGSVVTKLGAKNGLLHESEMPKWLKKQLKETEERL